jgi:curved DNA-binding protein
MGRSEPITAESARRLLGVDATADAAQLRAAFNRAVKKAHPDQGGDEAQLRRTLEAYRVLETALGMAEVEEAPAGPARRTSGAKLEIGLTLAMKGGRVMTELPDGRRVNLTLPAGLRTGDKISAGGTVLTVQIKGRPDAFVTGDDIYLTIPASPMLLRDGGRLKVKTPGGTKLVWVPKQVGTNRIVRVLGEGLPERGKHAQGSLILRLMPAKPGETDAKAKLKRFGADWAAA